MMPLNFIRCDKATIVLILVLLIFENVFYFKKAFYHMLFFIWNFLICMTFRLANTSLNTVSYSSLYMLYGLSDEMWDVRNVVCYGSDILRMWDLGDVRYSGCGMFGMWNVQDVGCGMWDVCQDVGCWFTNATQRQLEFQRWKWN